MGKGFQDTINWYDANAEKYAKSNANRFFQKEMDDFALLLSKGALVLDAGCGTGRDLIRLHTKGFKVIGLDISKGMLNVARRLYPYINFKEGNILHLPFDSDSVDGIWANASIIHFEMESEVRKAFSEFNRVLKNKGILRVLVKAKIGASKTEIVYDKDSKFNRFFRYFTKKEIEDFLKDSGFEIISSEQYKEVEKIIEGKSNREWIVVLARKL